MQINRLFEIIYILLEKKSVTASVLAKHFEVSVRTIYRDVEVLSGAGVPIYMSKGKGGGISLMPEYILNKTVLTAKEKIDILTSLRAVNSLNPNQTDSALSKLSSMFGGANTDWIEIDFSSWENDEDEINNFNRLKRAIIDRDVVRFEYSSVKGECTEREVLPLKMCYKGQAWYIYGFCRIRDDYRFFKLKRIKSLEVLEEKFIHEIPCNVFNDVSIYEIDPIELKLKISKEIAYRVYDEFTDYKVLADGDFICNKKFAMGDWVYDYISSFGKYCEILEPANIRLEMINRLKDSLNKYL